MSADFTSITKLEFHRYTLKSKGLKPVSRVGALVRVTFDDLADPGVADLFPWTELGDPSLESWLAELKTAVEVKTRPTSITLQRVLEAARDEAMANSRLLPLVSGSVLNHALATDPVDLGIGDIIEARRSTCPAIKVKIGKNDFLAEAVALSRLVGHWGGIRLRLDANERMTRDQLMRFLEALPILIRDSIEFIEDPFEFDLRAWSDFHRETTIPLAYDRGTRDRDLAGDSDGVTLENIFESQAAQILIHKPAWQIDERALLARDRGLPVVVTSILGHPVGNLWAARKAFELAPTGVHGCRSHLVYREDEASQALTKSKQVRGARVVGIGVGLGLQSRWWKRMKWDLLT